jgi:hypothetical protein
VPSGTVAKKKDMPLWLSEPPHCRIEEWMALKMWFALQTAVSFDAAATGLRRRESDRVELSTLRRMLTMLLQAESSAQLTSGGEDQNNS